MKKMFLDDNESLNIDLQKSLIFVYRSLDFFFLFSSGIETKRNFLYTMMI